MNTTIDRQLAMLEHGSTALTCGVEARIAVTNDWHDLHEWTPAFPKNFGIFYPQVREYMSAALRAYHTGGGSVVTLAEPPWYQLVSRECVCPRIHRVLRAQFGIPHAPPRMHFGLPCPFYLRKASATAQWLLACETEVLRVYLEQFVALHRIEEAPPAAERFLRRIDAIGSEAAQVAHLLDVQHPKLGAPHNPELYEPMAAYVIELKTLLGMIDADDSPFDADYHRQLHAFLTLWPYVYDWSSAVSAIGAQIELLLGNSPEPPPGAAT